MISPRFFCWSLKRAFQGLSLLAALNVQAALPDCYVNLGTVTNVPNINSPCFVNEGLFSVSTALLYDFQNVVNLTNRGTMQGYPGFRIDYVNDSGVRVPLDNFVNSGNISADLPFFLFGGGFFSLGSFFGGFFSPAIMISAHNLINRGEFRTSDTGLIRLIGDNVDLTRSSIGVLPIQGFGFAFPPTPTNFFPEPGIFDLYWGIGMDDRNQFAPGSLITLNGRNLTVTSPNHFVTNANFFFGQPTQLSLRNPSSYIFTNRLTETNWVVQGAFIGLVDTNVSVSVKFAPSPISTNVYKTIAVQLASQETNVLAGGNFLTTFYIIDRLISDTNYNILTNLATRAVGRPATYEVTRNTPVDFLNGIDSNAVITSDLFYNNTQSNRFVTNSYAAYAFSAGSQSTFVAPVPNASLTNSPGRIEIFAENLILDRARIRGQSIVRIKTDNLVSSSNSVVDVQNLHLNLGSASGDLKVKNLAKPFVERTQGDVFLWSGAWTNLTGSVVTNVTPDPMDPMLSVTNAVTNVIEIVYHALMVDSQALTTRQPVFTDSFTAKSEHVTISDIINVTSNLLVEANSVTIDGRLTLFNNVHDWSSRTFPGLNILTNLGHIFITGMGNYGEDRPDPYTYIINRGTNTAYSHFIRADQFENTGRMETAQIFTGGGQPIAFPNVGTISLTTRSGKLEGGQFVAGGDIRLAATDLKLRNYVTTAGKALSFSVTNTFEDSGGDANNTFSSGDGINLLIKPRFGDLLGSRFRTVAPRFSEVRHLWAAEDRGATKAGFSNNAAVGRLIVDGDLDTVHTFSGTGSANGLYVDFLELNASVQADLTNSLQITPDLVIYFADSNVPIEDLDGKLGGRLRWVKEFAGPNSSVDVALASGATVKVNRGLRQSRTIDSDSDGIANGFDLDPFGGIRIAKIEVTRAAPNTTLISFEAAADTTYVLEFTNTLFPPNWQPLTTFVNSSETNRVITLSDTVPGSARQRYYRVRYSVP